MDGVIRALQPLPQMARRSITFDRGTEFTEWSYLQNGIGSQIWFCDPQSPWQKGTVENINKRIRRYLPSNTDLAQVSQAQLTALAHKLNAMFNPNVVLSPYFLTVSIEGPGAAVKPDLLQVLVLPLGRPPLSSLKRPPIATLAYWNP